MAISKEKKRALVADYGQRLANSQAVILTDYRGLTVAGITDLRRRLREAGGSLQVVKITLFERVLADAGVPVAEGQLQGPLAVAYCHDDVPRVVKTLMDFAKETEQLQFRGAYFGKAYLNAEGAMALADLPPREVVLGQLLGTVQGPMSSLVSVIMAPLREIAQVLRARSEQGLQAAA